MKQTTRKIALSGILCIALLAAAALGITGCTPDTPKTNTETSLLYSPAEVPHALGEGAVTFPLTVTHSDGTTVEFEISTGADTVGQALEETDLIAGEEGPYGMMVTAVNGETLIYEQHKAYWGFYIDGAYAMRGVDETEIAAGSSYALTAEAA